MNKLFTVITGLLLMGSFHAEAADFEMAKDAVKNMGLGWNLGNTLDANDATKTWKTTAEHETCWGQPVTKPELIKMMKEAGFGAIRVPVTWYQEIDSEGKINDAWMKRVKEVVDYVINEGLYCIINVHHDTGADDGDFKSWIKADGTNYTQNKAKFEYIWKQIAETFKDYDQHLLFEGYNEMLDAKNTWNEPINKTDGYKAINDYAKSFISAVRATGGNNAYRNLIVNTYSGSNSANAMKALELPEQTGHIAFQIHNYPDWQSESHARELVDYLISIIKTNLISKGAPVIIGEYSTLCTYPKRDWYDVNRKVALYAMDYFIKRTKAEGIGTFFWMGLSDGTFRDFPAFNQADLAETLAKAYHGDVSSFKFPTLGDAENLTLWEGEAHLEWSTNDGRISINGNVFKEKDYQHYLQLTYTQNYAHYTGDDVYDDIQLQYGDWSAKPVFNVGDTQFGGKGSDLPPFTYYGTPSGTDHVTDLSFGEDVYKTICNKGLIVFGHGIIMKKIELVKTPSASGISDVQTYRDIRIGAVYDLQGQRVQNPRKGLYIQNGKKYLVK